MAGAGRCPRRRRSPSRRAAPLLEPLVAHLAAARASARRTCSWRERSTISGWWLAPEDPRHDAAAVARELHHRHAPRPGPATPCVSYPSDTRAPAACDAGMRSKRRLSTMRQAPAVGQLGREAAEPGMADAVVGEHSSRGGPRTCRPWPSARSDGLGYARPAAHHAEGVADAEERGVVVGGDRVEQREERRLPGGFSRTPWRPRRDAVVEARVEVARPAGAHVEANSAPPGASGRARPRAHVEGQHPHREADAAAARGCRSQVASSRSRTIESWPRLGKPWFMSSTATSITRSSAAGAVPGRSTRECTKTLPGASAGQSVAQYVSPSDSLSWQVTGIRFPGGRTESTPGLSGTPGPARRPM